MDTCILCGARATANKQVNASRMIYNCLNCSVYVVSDLVVPEVRRCAPALAAYFTNRKLCGYDDVVLISFEKAKKDRDYLQLTVEEILSSCPRTFAERIDWALRNLGRLSAYEGAEIKVENLDMCPVFCVKKPNYEALSFTIKAMQKMDLIDVSYLDSSFFPCGVTVSAAGWARISELEDAREESRSALLLLPDGEDDLEETFARTAKKAARECGYTVLTGEAVSAQAEVGHALIAAVRRSSMVIGDLSGAGGAGYYVAGLAAALKKPTVLSCHADRRGELRFLTDQISVLSWQTEKDLYLSLLNVIRAMEH